MGSHPCDRPLCEWRVRGSTFYSMRVLTVVVSPPQWFKAHWVQDKTRAGLLPGTAHPLLVRAHHRLHARAGRLTLQIGATLGLSSSAGAAQGLGTVHCRLGPLHSGGVRGAAWRTGRYTLPHGTAAARGTTVRGGNGARTLARARAGGTARQWAPLGGQWAPLMGVDANCILARVAQWVGSVSRRDEDNCS